MREEDSSHVFSNISTEQEESGSVGTYTKSLISYAKRCCFGVHFPKPEMQEAWLGFSASKNIRKETVYIDMVIMCMQLALFFNVFSHEEEDFIKISLPVSTIIRVVFYVFTLVPDDFACFSPWIRVKYFPLAAFLSLLMVMVIFQIQLGNMFDSIYLEFDKLSRDAWDQLCLEGRLDTSTDQTCVVAHGGVSSGGETSTFVIQTVLDGPITILESGKIQTQPSSKLLALVVHFGRFLTSISAMGLTLVQALLFGLESYFIFALTTVAIVIHVLSPVISRGASGFSAETSSVLSTVSSDYVPPENHIWTAVILFSIGLMFARLRRVSDKAQLGLFMRLYEKTMYSRRVANPEIVRELLTYTKAPRFLVGNPLDRVYTGTYSGNLVAIKDFQSCSTGNMVLRQSDPVVLRELTKLAELKHPNITGFYGAYFKAESADSKDYNLSFLVFEGCQQNLRTVYIDSKVGRRTSKKVIPVEELLTVALGISTGMAYLHDSNFIHGALRPEHVMLIKTPNGKMEIKVTIFDVGVSKLLRGRQEENHFLATPELSESHFEAGDILWNVEPTYLAPEYAKDVLDAEQRLGDIYDAESVGDYSPHGQFPGPSDDVTREHSSVASADSMSDVVRGKRDETCVDDHEVIRMAKCGDVYAFAMLLWELLTGQEPYTIKLDPSSLSSGDGPPSDFMPKDSSATSAPRRSSFRNSVLARQRSFGVNANLGGKVYLPNRQFAWDPLTHGFWPRLTDNEPTSKLLSKVISEDLRPEIGTSASIPQASPFVSVIEECWQPEPKNRCTFMDICDALYLKLERLQKVQKQRRILQRPQRTIQMPKGFRRSSRMSLQVSRMISGPLRLSLESAKRKIFVPRRSQSSRLFGKSSFRNTINVLAKPRASTEDAGTEFSVCASLDNNMMESESGSQPRILRLHSAIVKSEGSLPSPHGPDWSAWSEQKQSPRFQRLSAVTEESSLSSLIKSESSTSSMILEHTPRWLAKKEESFANPQSPSTIPQHASNRRPTFEAKHSSPSDSLPAPSAINVDRPAVLAPKNSSPTPVQDDTDDAKPLPTLHVAPVLLPHGESGAKDSTGEVVASSQHEKLTDEAEANNSQSSISAEECCVPPSTNR